jgi:hypothetical protein
MHTFGKTIVAMALVAFAALPQGASAVGPAVVLDGSTHVVTFVTPGIYDFTANESFIDGALSSARIITHDVNGRVEGTIIDQGDGVTLTTDITGRCSTRNGRTFLKLKEKGYGDLGDGQSITAVGVRKSIVYGEGTGAVLHSVMRMNICIKQNKPFSTTKTFTKCHAGGGGRGETLLGDVGDWTVRMELEQPVAGKILGTGSVTTNIHQAKYARTTQAIVAGSVGADGVARLRFTSLQDGGDGPVTITARVVAGEGIRHPAVTEILGVSGKLLGQRFNEVY